SVRFTKIGRLLEPYAQLLEPYAQRLVCPWRKSSYCSAVREHWRSKPRPLFGSLQKEKRAGGDQPSGDLTSQLLSACATCRTFPDCRDSPPDGPKSGNIAGISGRVPF